MTEITVDIDDPTLLDIWSRSDSAHYSIRSDIILWLRDNNIEYKINQMITQLGESANSFTYVTDMSITFFDTKDATLFKMRFL